MTGALHERIDAVRDALAGAKDSEPPAREEHIKTALGEVLYLAAHEGVRTADLHELLTSAVVAPDEEVPYFLNRASDMLETLEEDLPNRAGDEAEPPRANGPEKEELPESVRRIDEDHGVLELELTRPFIEWIELEADQHDFDSVAEWVRTQLWVRLTEDLMQNHGFTVDVEVEVPHDYARRVALWRADRETEGELEEADVEAFLFNHIQFQPTWTLDGEPWELVENHDQDSGEGSE